jgi:hypothetical protein
VLNHLAAADAREDIVFLGLACGWDDQADRLSNRLARRIAKHALGGVVPRGDDAGQVLADNGILRRLDQGGKLSACGFGASTFRYVAIGFQDDRATVDVDHLVSALDEHFPSIPGVMTKLAGPFPALAELSQECVQTQRMFRLEQFVAASSERVVTWIAIQAFASGVPLDDSIMQVPREDRFV